MHLGEWVRWTASDSETTQILQVPDGHVILNAVGRGQR